MERMKKQPYNWKGDKASHSAIHSWLRSHYGKADHCVATDCSGESKRFEWALISGMKHSHNRDNYRQLCKKCHVKYDGSPSGESHHKWKGGKAKCKNCGKGMSVWPSQTKTGLCGTCNRKLNPPWKGKSRREYNLKHKKDA